MRKHFVSIENQQINFVWLFITEAVLHFGLGPSRQFGPKKWPKYFHICRSPAVWIFSTVSCYLVIFSTLSRYVATFTLLLPELSFLICKNVFSRIYSYTYMYTYIYVYIYVYVYIPDFCHLWHDTQREITLLLKYQLYVDATFISFSSCLGDVFPLSFCLGDVFPFSICLGDDLSTKKPFVWWSQSYCRRCRGPEQGRCK